MSVCGASDVVVQLATPSAHDIDVAGCAPCFNVRQCCGRFITSTCSFPPLMMGGRLSFCLLPSCTIFNEGAILPGPAKARKLMSHSQSPGPRSFPRRTRIQHMGTWWGCGPLGRCTLYPGAKRRRTLLGPSTCLRPPAQTKAHRMPIVMPLAPASTHLPPPTAARYCRPLPEAAAKPTSGASLQTWARLPCVQRQAIIEKGRI